MTPYQGDQVGDCEWNDDCADVLVALVLSTTSFMDVGVIGLNENVPALAFEDLLDLLLAASYSHASVLHQFTIFYEQHQFKTLCRSVKFSFTSEFYMTKTAKLVPDFDLEYKFLPVTTSLF
jgi:hypothetical protein